MTPFEAESNLVFLRHEWENRKQLVERLLFCQSAGARICADDEAVNQLKESSRKCDSKLAQIESLIKQMRFSEIHNLRKEFEQTSERIIRLTREMYGSSENPSEDRADPRIPERSRLLAERDECCSRQTALLQQLEQLSSPICQTIRILLEEVSA